MPNYEGSLDAVFQALADPTRRDMVERLIRGPLSVSRLAQPLAMSLPAVMQHLQVLEACGLVRSEKAGRVRTCHIEPAGLRAAEGWIGRQRTEWEHRLDRLGGHLAEAEQDRPSDENRPERHRPSEHDRPERDDRPPEHRPTGQGSAERGSTS